MLTDDGEGYEHDHHRRTKHQQVAGSSGRGNDGRTGKCAEDCAEPAESKRGRRAGCPHAGRIDVRAERIHRRLDCVDEQTVQPDSSDQECGLMLHVRTKGQSC